MPDDFRERVALVTEAGSGIGREAALAFAARGAAAARLSDVAVSRIAEPDELMRLVLFIACDELSFSTGSEFIAAGGMLLGPVPDSSLRA